MIKNLYNKFIYLSMMMFLGLHIVFMPEYLSQASPLEKESLDTNNKAKKF